MSQRRGSTGRVVTRRRSFTGSVTVFTCRAAVDDGCGTKHRALRSTGNTDSSANMASIPVVHQVELI